jgi:tetratricopeptide (TPR) repeat protein
MDVPEAARGSWLDGLRGEDAVLRPWLTRVLGSAGNVHTSHFMDAPCLAVSPEDGYAPGMQIGPYLLEVLLGEGGMGQVWRARRTDGGTERDVALKVLRPEVVGVAARVRFRRERDVVAGLNHPHIAQLYEAAMAPDEAPYLALELVSGLPITEYCRSHAAPLQRRLDLIVEVLAALSYAHARLIVHRDIKPSNVLVTQDGGVKLLDFGIAKLLRPDETRNSQLTQPAALLATPGYSAPEQFSHGAITVAADVFSAGILLFELMTGRRPFRTVPTAADAAPAPLASQRADAEAAGAPEGARLRRRLHGDLDAVLARALALDPAERYPSAEAFAADVRRFQAGKPVSARLLAWPARASRFVRRNRLAVGLASVLAVAMVGGSAGVAWQAHRASLEAARATAIKDYVIGLFGEADPRTGRPSATMTAKELLDIGASRADAAFARNPETEIELLGLFGNYYDAFSDGPRAEAMWRRKLELARKLYGLTDPRTLDSVFDLVASYVVYQDEDPAKQVLAEIRAPLLSRYGLRSLQWAAWLTAQANALRETPGARDEAIADDLAAIAIFDASFPDDPGFAGVLDDLSGYQYDADDYAGSVASMQKARAIRIAHHNNDAMEDLEYHINLGDRMMELGRLQEARTEIAFSTAQARKLMGEQTLWYLHELTSSAIMASLTGDRVGADILLRDMLKGRSEGAAATGVPTSMRRAYGAALARDGRAAEAVPILEKVLAETRLHRRDEANLRRTEQQLGDAYDAVGRTDDARIMLRASRDEYLRYGNPGKPHTLEAEERWGRFLLDHKEPGAAAEFQAVLQQSAGAPSIGAAMAAAGLARIALVSGKVQEADRDSALALSLMETTTLLYDVRRRVDIWLVRAQVLAALGRVADARDFARQALASAQNWDAPGSPQITHAAAITASISL